jgi:cytochrome c oxidase subunit II
MRTWALVGVLLLMAGGCRQSTPSKAPEAVATNASMAATRPATKPSGPLTLRITARQYAWTTQYPGGGTSDELHLPAGAAVTVHLTSRDVIHALFIPELRLKWDAMPAHVNTFSFTVPKQAGEMRLMCAELCGPGHSSCGARVVIESPEEFEAWVSQLASSK